MVLYVESSEHRAILSRVDQLEPMPAVVARCLNVMSNPDHSFSDLRRVIEVDQVTTENVLRLANSAAYGRRVGDAASLDRAIAILGEVVIIQVVLDSVGALLRKGPVPGYLLEAEQLWEHSLRMAVASQVIAEQCGGGAGMAYACGFLADIGKVVVGASLASLQASVVSDEAFDAAERTLFGLDHAEVSAWIAQKWELPRPMQLALQFHHRPALSPDCRTLVFTVHLADAIALTIAASGVDDLRYEVDETWADHLVVGPENVEALIALTVARTKEVRDRLMNE